MNNLKIIDGDRDGREALALDLTRQLKDFETQLDATSAAAGALFAAVAKTRLEMEVDIAFGQMPLANLADAIQGLAAVRSKVVRSHASLAIARKEVGLDHLAAGDVPKKLA